jgi:hypothetical protein
MMFALGIALEVGLYFSTKNNGVFPCRPLTLPQLIATPRYY